MPQPHGDNSPSVYPGDIEQQAAPPPPRISRRRCGQFLGDQLQNLMGLLTSILRWIPRIICFMIMLLVPVAAVGGFVMLFVWVGMGAGKPHVSVSNAFLTGFNLTRAADAQSYSLAFNLTVDIGLRNGNRRHTLCYRSVESIAYYDGQRLAGVLLPDICQGSKTSSNVTVIYAGSTGVELDQSAAGFFENERRTGSFAVEVSVNGGIRARLDSVGWKYKTDVNHVCKIEVPLLASNGTSAANSAFSPVDCEDVSPPPAPSYP